MPLQKDLYTDDDPSYARTRLNSGIPPPSLRDRRQDSHDRPHHHQQQYQQHQQGRRRDENLSGWNPATQRPSHRQESYHPYPQQQRQSYNSGGQTIPNQANPSSFRPSHNSSSGYPPRDQYRNERHIEERPREERPRETRHQEPQRQREERPKAQHAKVDLRTSTDFLVCEDPSKKLSIDQITANIRASGIKDKDDDFISSAELIQKANALRETIRQAPAEPRSTARARSNPFESIGKSIFMNRAATKLAALDATFSLSSTSDNKPLVFADLCGGPGGFTEYLLWRVCSGGGNAHGYGITLKMPDETDELNWQTGKFRSDAPLNFTIIDGPDGSGNLYHEANILGFGSKIMSETSNQGVDLVVADGGFDFTGKEEHQENYAQRLLLCEAITMLTCLKKGGTYVCKFFDMNEEFTADLVWLLYQLFEMVCITKPLTSRPANSERYLVCKQLRFQQPTGLINALMRVQNMMEHKPVMSFVKAAVLTEDEEFFDYVKMRNFKMLLKQINSLTQLDLHLKDPQRPLQFDQEAIRRQCLAEWRLPLR
ncbi:hypothetical protein PHYBLDRAFT_185181 [Phycomyces blakesleeanus NRRL 1555(-)]|uniref:Cap-specific mRNA (nucleoside-2'-O-)-methyltransferase 1 n=2 Tax=Phycomyces blakesleeanus TaxID=4837 RepID=A0A163EFA8_PHYB8|nr:hypothetical protein PHYBLDRAFT_185181 [Phycomyces blakesleeanus NRRL 1555(-)]OAD78340.1 hypothetical protein PHYBLDRAFT_185181 [Phycomyces blakesleeanus NRRL 1555(-)]|eukprot:XP_018296380.1 hypothetical protein PHYBLDRAFT_185181 [Phycomyces blakesleeanus NRRL 1555(-)]